MSGGTEGRVPRIIGVGDNVVDRYPQLGKCFPGGNALNVAVFARRRGLHTAYIGWLGTDAAGRHIHRSLESEGVDVSRVRMVEGANAFDVVHLQDGEREFVGSSKGIAASFTLSADDLAFVRDFDLVHTSVYSLTESHLPALKQACGRLSFDYSSVQRLTEEYLEATLPFVDYACFSAGRLSIQEIRRFHDRVRGKGPRAILLTRGEEGAALYQGGNEFLQRAIAVEVTDTLGAGDAFIAVCLTGFLESTDIPSGLRAAAEEAARTCTNYGAFGYPLDIPSI
jgi:fructoselysine 6-kinase